MSWQARKQISSDAQTQKKLQKELAATKAAMEKAKLQKREDVEQILALEAQVSLNFAASHLHAKIALRIAGGRSTGWSNSIMYLQYLQRLLRSRWRTSQGL